MELKSPTVYPTAPCWKTSSSIGFRKKLDQHRVGSNCAHQNFKPATPKPYTARNPNSNMVAFAKDQSETVMIPTSILRHSCLSPDYESKMSSTRHSGNEDEPDSMFGTSNFASAFIDTADTTRTETGANSFTSNISMNRVDEKEAFNRLIIDLSEDEVSMMIDMFGVTCNSTPADQHTLSFLGESQPVVEDENNKCRSNLVPQVKSPILNDMEYLLTRRSSEGKNCEPLPRSYFHRNYPLVESQTSKAVGMMQHGENRTPCSFQTTVNPVTQEANDILLHFPVSALSVQVPGEPLSKTLAKEHQMAKKRSDHKVLLSKLPTPPPTPILAPANKKSSDVLKGGRPLSSASITTTSTIDVATSFTTITTITTDAKRNKAVSTTRQRDKNSKRSNVAAPVDTYIIHLHNPDEDRWNQRLKEAHEFVLKNGHGRIPTTYLPNPDLASWAKRQRYHYKIFKKHILDRPKNPAVEPAKIISPEAIPSKTPGSRFVKCLMNFERLVKLKSIGFCMDLQAGSWMSYYEKLCDYARRNNGRTYCSKHTHYKLWKWIGTQRYQMKLWKKARGTRRNMPCLTPERIAKLNKINFCWEDRFAVEEHERS